MNANDVKLFIKGLNDLSTIPALMGKIASVMRDENAAPEDLYNLISLDQALAQRVLRVANSVFFGHSGQIRDIQQAILFLGYNRIRSIALGMTMMEVFPARGSFQIENLWIHGYEVAFLASALTDSILMSGPRECFLSGLLHDIGRIILYKMDHDAFSRIETTDGMLEQERAAFGCTHAEAGAWFSESIGLPSEIVMTTMFHHHPSGAEERMELVSIIALAEALSRRFSPRIEDDGIWTPEHDTILLEFHLTESDIKQIGERFAETSLEIQNFLSRA